MTCIFCNSVGDDVSHYLITNSLVVCMCEKHADRVIQKYGVKGKTVKITPDQANRLLSRSEICLETG